MKAGIFADSLPLRCRHSVFRRREPLPQQTKFIAHGRIRGIGHKGKGSQHLVTVCRKDVRHPGLAVAGYGRYKVVCHEIVLVPHHGLRIQTGFRGCAEQGMIEEINHRQGNRLVIVGQPEISGTPFCRIVRVYWETPQTGRPHRLRRYRRCADQRTTAVPHTLFGPCRGTRRPRRRIRPRRSASFPFFVYSVRSVFPKKP